MFKTYLLIGLGGFLGSISRFAVGQYVQRLLHTTLPYGTLTVNIVGSFIIGLLYGLSEYHNWLSPSVRMFLAVGFCGGFTTFSSFAYENIGLLREEQYLYFFLYIVASVVLGLLAAWLGLIVIKSLG